MSLFRRIGRMGRRLSPFSSSCRYARLCLHTPLKSNRVLLDRHLPPEYAVAWRQTGADVHTAAFTPRELARAAVICAAAPLPAWYSVREGQTLRLLLTDGGASFSLPQLLSAAVLVVAKTHLPALQKRVGPIFSGRIVALPDGSAEDMRIQALCGLAPDPVPEQSAAASRRLLIYGGSLAVNGVTTSLVYRLRSLDPARYDITLLLPETVPAAARDMLSSLPEWVRILPSSGSRAATLREWFCWWRLSRRGGDPDNRANLPLRAFLAREAKRRVGLAQFDALVDYSGYGAYYPLLFLQIPCARRLIWQHNDIRRDMTNRDKGKQRRYRYFCAGLSVVTQLYPRFDRVVSASAAVYAQNRRNFALPGQEERFVFCNNLIDADAVRQKAAADCTLVRDGKAYYGDGDMSSTSLRAPMPDPACFSFVTMGRLSPEKNQDALIRAFARLAGENDRVRLTLIGSGEWEDKLRALAAEFAVADKVTFTGDLQNPFAYLKHFDAFVFVSHYEAMGLAVIEARILGLPIVLSDYPAASSVSVPGGQITVDQTPNGICAGMRELMAAPEKAWAPFDEEEERRRSAAQFDALFADGM